MTGKMTKVTDVIFPETISLDEFNPSSKSDLFDHMSSMFLRAHVIKSKLEFIESLYEREAMGPTYMGEFIAIPHGKSSTVTHSAIAFCRTKTPFYYESEDQNDGGLVRLVFMLAVPASLPSNEYIGLLARLARLLVYPKFLTSLRRIKSYEGLIRSISRHEPLLDQD